MSMESTPMNQTAVMRDPRLSSDRVCPNPSATVSTLDRIALFAQQPSVLLDYINRVLHQAAVITQPVANQWDMQLALFRQVGWSVRRRACFLVCSGPKRGFL